MSLRSPFIPLNVSFGRQAMRVEALLDTGFEGDVIVPERLVMHAGPPDLRRHFRMADGSVVDRAAFLGRVAVGQLGVYPALIVALGDECLMGLDLANRFRITLDHGRELVVEP